MRRLSHVPSRHDPVARVPQLIDRDAAGSDGSTDVFIVVVFAIRHFDVEAYE